MTKFEWERNLKKSLGSLPPREQKRIFDYYDELFADKIESGMREEQIIAEFGNPYEVADRILRESEDGGFFGTEATYSVGQPPHQHEYATERPRKKRSFLGVFVGILFVIFIFIPVIAVVLSVFVGSLAVQISGVVLFIYSFFGYTIGSAVWLCVLGVSIAGIGAGKLLWWAGCLLYKVAKWICKKLFGVRTYKEATV